MRYTILDSDGLDIALAATPAEVRDFARRFGANVRFISETTAQLSA